MTFKSLIAPVALVAAAGLLSACSTSTESLETTDVFAPAAEVAVPAPIPGAAIDFQTLQAPPPIQQIVQAPQPQLLPPQQQFLQPPLVEQQPFVDQQFVEAPDLPQVPVQPQYVEVQQPTYNVGFDCSVIPSSKAGLSEYRANCLAAQ